MVATHIVCLANSWREGGRCVAGVTLGSEWVRPVSATGGALKEADCLLDTGVSPKLLDVIEIPLGQTCPTQAQPENRYVEQGAWRFVRHLQGRPAMNLLTGLEQSDDLLFGSSGDSIEAADLDNAPSSSSLTIVQPVSVRWYVRARPGSRPQTRGVFSLQHTMYDLSLTDPEFAPADGATTDSPFLTISLGEEYVETGRCYKILAGVIAL